MAVAKNPYSNYTNHIVSTASKEKITLMLYDGALKFVNQAMIALETKNYEKVNEAVFRALDIIRELQTTLDRKYEISDNLFACYEYIHERLVSANAAKDADIFAETRDYLRQFRDTWKEAMERAQKLAQSG